LPSPPPFGHGLQCGVIYFSAQTRYVSKSWLGVDVMEAPLRIGEAPRASALQAAEEGPEPMEVRGGGYMSYERRRIHVI